MPNAVLQALSGSLAIPSADISPRKDTALFLTDGLRRLVSRERPGWGHPAVKVHFDAAVPYVMSRHFAVVA